MTNVTAEPRFRCSSGRWEEPPTLPLIRRPRSTSPGARRARGEGGSNLKTRRRPMANKATGGHKVTRRPGTQGRPWRRRRRRPDPASRDSDRVGTEHQGHQAGAGGDLTPRSSTSAGRPRRISVPGGMQSAAHDALLNRFVTQPNSVDIADMEYFFLYHLVPRGVLHTIDLKKYSGGTRWCRSSRGRYPDGRKVSRTGCASLQGPVCGQPGVEEVCQGPDPVGHRDTHGVQRRYAGIRPDS